MFTIDDYWKILDVIQGETVEDITEAVEAIAKSEKSVSDKYFSTIIDQIAYITDDYNRIRNFLRDWNASFRTIATFQTQITDVYSMPNDQLDELFQSFGYNYSASLRDPVTNEPLLQKVNFFLDLVNLYKIKGSPETLVRVLQYYGFNQVDVYEYQLQFDDRPGKDSNALMFKGNIVAGTSGDKSPLYLPYDELTIGDPHWLYTEDQIRTLFTLNKINFPSTSPYFSIKPIFDEVTTYLSIAMLSRVVQDQYFAWQSSGIPPEKNAIATITGDKVSILALYLSCITIFNREWSVGVPDMGNFLCYDGTSTVVTDIIDQYNIITGKPSSRLDQKQKLAQYYDLFTREDVRNFLQNSTDAETILAVLDPSFYANLNSVADVNQNILASLLVDLGNWMRSNLSYGFMNISYALFGVGSLYSLLRDVIEFFKPYRARIVPLEMLEFKSRLENTIIIEDKLDTIDVLFDFYDYCTGNSAPCCADPTLVCPDSTDAFQYYSRDTYDCGSFYDIGIVVDKDPFIEYFDTYRDSLVCSFNNTDSSAIVTSEVLFDSTSYFYYYQTGGFAKFDDGGNFDCTSGFDLVIIEMILANELLLENGYRLLLENGDHILL